MNADFESGFAHGPEDLAESVRLCVATGVAGLSIEDSTGDSSRPLFDLPIAVERIAGRPRRHRRVRRRRPADRPGRVLSGGPARSRSRSRIRRLEAYAAAGADVLYAPGPRDPRRDIAAIVGGVAPKPVNVLVGSNIGLTLTDLADLGVRRVSVGSSLARAAWTRFIHAATGIATTAASPASTTSCPTPSSTTCSAARSTDQTWRRSVVERSMPVDVGPDNNACRDSSCIGALRFVLPSPERVGDGLGEGRERRLKDGFANWPHRFNLATGSNEDLVDREAVALRSMR